MPVHDVLAGHDWVQKHLARTSINLNQAYPSLEAANIGVCGELVGGSLASMLALTEGRSANGGIEAAAVGNPIVDWTSLSAADNDDVSQTSNSAENPISMGANHEAPLLPFGKDRQSLTYDTLLHLRSKLFAHAEKYFDPFASTCFETPSAASVLSFALHIIS